LSKLLQIFPLLLALLLSSCGWFDAGPVTGQDSDVDGEGFDGNESVADAPEHDEADAPLPDGPQDPDVVIDIEEDDAIPPDVPIDLPADDAPEILPSTCGNGLFEASEACDDLNTVTEPCGMGTSCLGDCSMLEATCGNAANDRGEPCDDGNLHHVVHGERQERGSPLHVQRAAMQQLRLHGGGHPGMRECPDSYRLRRAYCMHENPCLGSIA
jgi:hypothetical protein